MATKHGHVSTESSPEQDIEMHGITNQDAMQRHRSDPIANHLQSLQVDSAEDVSVSEGGYGWMIVLCVFLVNAVSWGTNSAYGVILAFYISHNTYPDATSLDYAFVAGLTLSQALLSAPFTAITNRKFGTRITLTIGTAVLTGAFVSASFATQKWHVFITQGVLPGWGMGFLFVGSAGLIPQWFTSKRSLANGIATSGVGIGGIVFNLVTGRVIKTGGAPWAFRVLAIGAFFAGIACVILAKDRNETVKPAQVAFDLKLLRRKEFLLLVGWGFLSEFGYVVMWFTLPTFAVFIGLDTQQSSVIGAVVNVGMATGRPLLGYFSDKMGRINIATLFTGFSGIMCLVFWTFVKTYPTLLVFSLIIGASCGIFWATVSPVVPEIVGLQGVPGAFSMLFLVMVIPSLFAEPIALTLSQGGQNAFLHTQIFVGFVYIGAALCAWFLRPWKIRQLERLADPGMESLTRVESASGRRWQRNFVSETKWVLKQLVSPKRI